MWVAGNQVHLAPIFPKEKPHCASSGAQYLLIMKKKYDQRLRNPQNLAGMNRVGTQTISALESSNRGPILKTDPV